MKTMLGHWPGDERPDGPMGPAPERRPLSGERLAQCEKWSRLPAALAARYRKRIRAVLGLNIHPHDLESAAVLGLVIAASKFEPERGLSLSTYATPWIFQQMQRHVRYQHHTVRIPPHVLHDIRRIENGEEPIGSTAECRAAAQKVLRSQRTRPEYPFEPAARDRPHLFEIVDRVRDALRFLKPRHRQVIELRFGLTGGRALGLEEIGQIMGITRERVRQLQNKAMPKIGRRLRTFWKDLSA